MKLLPKILLASIFTAVLVAAKAGSTTQQNGLPGDPFAGAQIYDNWMTAQDLKPPDGDQPLWANQESNTRSGDVTWRCKECHGWDYKGSEGAFAPNSVHYTAFPSINTTVGSSQEEVLAWLDGSNNPEHNFLQYTNPNAMSDLAVFLRTMQVDLALVVDYETGLSLGSESAGEELFLSACASCHGQSGRAINFASAGSPLFVGDLAAVDPWKTIHLIRFGTAVGNMPGTEESGWSLGKVADVLAYAQGLPRGNPNFAIFEEIQDEAIADQGETEPMLWAALAILLVIAGGLAWEKLRER